VSSPSSAFLVASGVGGAGFVAGVGVIDAAATWLCPRLQARGEKGTATQRASK
jgi:hypothetical protein